jgi:hypothetical protein
VGALAGMAIAACQSPIAQKPTIIADNTNTTEESPDRGRVEATDALTMLAEIPTAPEDDTIRYVRDDWHHWISQGNQCDTREMVIRSQGSDPSGALQVEIDPATCEARTGRWVSVYDGQVITDPSALDVDHIVALKEMHQSGANDWPDDLRQRYANDTDVLVAVSRASNRAKGDRDPADWLPAASVYRCSYAYSWVLTKWKYNQLAGPVTVDQRERDALATAFAACPPESLGIVEGDPE